MMEVDGVLEVLFAEVLVKLRKRRGNELIEGPQIPH